ncbi:MAG: hypothetical protein SGPRY_013172, partial [Prymnesium sp.]
MSEENGLNMEGLRDFYSHEQLEYLLQAYIGKANPAKPSSLPSQVVTSNFSSVIHHTCAQLNAFGGWFDVQFCGSPNDPAPNPVELTTAPTYSTHWGQQVGAL